ncbi:MAG: hypothetical protein WA478_19310, partial [Pseudolabrys sp.]
MHPGFFRNEGRAGAQQISDILKPSQSRHGDKFSLDSAFAVGPTDLTWREHSMKKTIFALATAAVLAAGTL